MGNEDCGFLQHRSFSRVRANGSRQMAPFPSLASPSSPITGKSESDLSLCGLQPLPLPSTGSGLAGSLLDGAGRGHGFTPRGGPGEGRG
jgi:hypothetical protein